MFGFLKKLFSYFSWNERQLRRYEKIIDIIDSYKEKYKDKPDSFFKQQTLEFKELLRKGHTLDDILPQAYALCSLAAKRVLSMEPFKVQLMGAIALHEGKIIEMKTGEGKTLVATMPAYLNGLLNRLHSPTDFKNVHIVTVNDYLAKRDAEWMGKIYKFLEPDEEFAVSVLYHDMDYEERKKAYQANIVYGTNSEFGFDYLRDNMAYSKEEMVQTSHYFAIVDEVDSILIDEARTPLIISGPAEEDPSIYTKLARIAPRFKKDIHFELDEKNKNVTLKEEGYKLAEELLKVKNLYSPENYHLIHQLIQALRALHLFKRDVDYVVKDGQVVIVDEFTGRLMFGRRWSDGLHQAVEAKEGLQVQGENRTLATITIQNYFRMYEKLAGMTGTAATEAAEFSEIYGLDVVVIPTNKPVIRVDHPDVIYKTKKEKFKAVIDEIKKAYAKKQPVLVGTTSIENSELLSTMLKREGIPHQVLNAKYHEKEAAIIAEAGKAGAVTIATNMAGRGTDIVLDEEAKKAGGLYVIGTERHESRRIDNQLRGRSGRQGDPGQSRFFLSLEDDLMRLFGGDQIKSMMEFLNIPEGEPIESSLVSSAIENAQKRVERHNFEIRKHILKYDDVLNKQRDAVYTFRRQVLESENLNELIYRIFDYLANYLVDEYINNVEIPQFEDLQKILEQDFALKLSVDELKELNMKDELKDYLKNHFIKVFEEKSKKYEPIWKDVVKFILLRSLDRHWLEHMANIDMLKEGIGLRAYAQKDPLIEFQIETRRMFDEMLLNLRKDITAALMHVEIQEEEPASFERRKREYREIKQEHTNLAKPQTIRRTGKKVGRNDPCPCGSGKKYKHCCGRK